MDNLTIEWLRAKHTELENNVKEVQERQAGHSSLVELVNNKNLQPHTDTLTR